MLIECNCSRAVQEHLTLVPQLGLDQRLVHVLQLEVGGCNTVQHHALDACPRHNMGYVSTRCPKPVTPCQPVSPGCVSTFFDADGAIGKVLHYGLDGDDAVHVRLGAQPLADPEALDVHVAILQVGDLSLRSTVGGIETSAAIMLHFIRRPYKRQ